MKFIKLLDKGETIGNKVDVEESRLELRKLSKKDSLHQNETFQ